MSLRLYYRPIMENKMINTDGKLIEILEKKIGVFPKVVSHELTSYLEALIDAEVMGAKELLDAINKYGSVELLKDE